MVKHAKKVEEASVKANGNGKASRLIDIPPIRIEEIHFRIVGDRPLMVNNKLAVIETLDAIYNRPGGKLKAQAAKVSVDEAYARAFYVLPSSKYQPPNPKGIYGIPTSGIKKCVDKAIRTTGITDNTTIGEITKSFFVLEDEAGLCRLHFKELTRDVRGVNIGSGQKTVPQLRHRPMFHDWYIDLRVQFNPLRIDAEALVNLFNHAGQFIGLCEMRAEKKQGTCGGFYAEIPS